MTKLTKRQSEVLKLIESHLASTGSPPTRAEIAKKMGFRSPNAAEDHLRALARKGVIELVSGTSRGIRLTKSNGIPIISNILPRTSILADENIERRTTFLDKHFFSPSIDFLYRVHSSEFNQQGILAGDLVAVHQTSTVETGQFVLLRLNNEITIRRYAEALEAQNPTIEGLLVGVIRNLPGSSLK